MMNGNDPRALPATWREHANAIRSYAIEAASVFDLCADQLEAAIEAWDIEALTVEEAATESGFSESHLYRTLRDGALPNAGSRGSPRVRRRDLPIKGRASA